MTTKIETSWIARKANKVIREVDRLRKANAGWETAARAAGWTKRDSHFTRGGVSIAYVDWRTLCLAEGIAKAAGR